MFTRIDTAIERVGGRRRAITTDQARLRDAVRLAINDLELEHRPAWSSEAAESAGKAPIGCEVCWPRDGHWPCTSRQVCDDLRRALNEEGR